MAKAAPTTVALEVPDGLEIRLQDVPLDDPLETIRRGAPLVSEKVGLVKAIGHGIYRPQDPFTYSVGIVSTDISRFTEIPNAGKAGGGGESFEVALAATLGESVERYCMLFYDKSKMVFAPWKEISELAPHPDKLRLFSNEQMEHRKRFRPDIRWAYLDEDAQFYWAWGWSLTHDKPRLVPAPLVYMEYRYEENEDRTGANASSGLAAGLTLESAILSGLYEVVERDAFTMSWMHHLVQRKIEVDDEDLSRRLRDHFHAERDDVRVELFDITLDIPIPSVFAVMQRQAEWGPSLCVSSVTRLSPEAAARKSLREMGQSLPYIRYLWNHLKDWEPHEDHYDLTSFDHHFMLYQKRPELVPDAMSHIDNVQDVVRLSEMPDLSTGSVKGDLERCLELLREQGHEVIVVELTTPDMRQLGFRVVRVLIPGMLAMHGNHNFPYLGVQRLYDIPHQLGWAEKKSWDPNAGLNPRPHPFP